MKTSFPAIFALSLAALCSSAFAQSTGTPLNMSGDVITDAQGRTVYTFDKDAANSGKSACYDACAAAWPPVMAGPDVAPSGDLSVITRDDGAKQLAYKGMPLYYYAKDTKSGDKMGDKMRDVWHVVTP